MNKSLKWIVPLAAGLLAVVALMLAAPPKTAADLAVIGHNERVADEAMERQWMAGLPAVTAHELALAYRKNADLADKDFRGRQFTVSGMVLGISADAMGEPYLTLRGGTSEFLQPQFGFARSASRELSKLKSGFEVSMMCTGKGEVAKVPVADSCVLLEAREQSPDVTRLSASGRDGDEH